MVIALFCIAVLQLAVAAISEEIAALACLVLSSWIFAALYLLGAGGLFRLVIATRGISPSSGGSLLRRSPPTGLSLLSLTGCGVLVGEWFRSPALSSGLG